MMSTNDINDIKACVLNIAMISTKMIKEFGSREYFVCL